MLELTIGLLTRKSNGCEPEWEHAQSPETFTAVDELTSLLDNVDFGADDQLISVGDLIKKETGFGAVMGNHDLALRRRWNGEKFKLKSSQKPTHKELKSDKEHYA